VFLSVSFKVAISHPSRFVTYQATDPHYLVRATYGEDKEILKHKKTLPLEKITLANNLVYDEKISSSSRVRAKHARASTPIQKVKFTLKQATKTRGGVDV
jgi:hypothetical protein